MRTRLAVQWAHLMATYWFLPGAMALGGLSLAIASRAIDAAFADEHVPGLGWFEVTDAAGAREVLSTVTTSAITVAGVVFSITMVVLNMASQQFGPRLLRRFMEHKGTQIVFGVFVGTSAFGLYGLTGIGESPGDVGRLTTLITLVFGLSSFGALVYFVHHVSVFVRVSRFIDDVALNLQAGLHRAFPPAYEHHTVTTPDEERHERDLDDDTPRTTVLARDSRYLQAIEHDTLIEIARDHDAVLHLGYRAGDFVVAGTPLVFVTPPRPELSPKVERRLRDAFVLGPERTSDQDPEFAVSQLAQIALRALSPALNDPHTAINCIDRIGGALVELTGRQLDSRYLRDGLGRVRVVTKPQTYASVVEIAFDQLRVAASDHPSVVLRMLDVIAAVAAHDVPEPVRAALREQVEAIAEQCRGRFGAERDRDGLARRHQLAMAALSGRRPPP